MSDSSIRFGQPQQVGDLRTAKLWSIDFAEEKFPHDAFRFFLCEKTDSGYLVHGHADTTKDAFRLRRTIAEELGAKIFVRAKRIEQTIFSADGDDDACLERFKGWYAEGVGIEDVDRHLRKDYMAFLRGRRSAN